MRKSKREMLKRSIYPKLVISEMETIKRRVSSFNNRLIEKVFWNENSEEVMAWTFMADGRFYEAMKEFEKLEVFFKEDNRTLEYKTNRCLCLLELGRIEEADREFTTTLDKPGSYDIKGAEEKIIDLVMLIIAMRESVEKKYGSALEVYHEILCGQTNDFLRTYALKGMGEINEKLGRIEEAKGFYHSAWEGGGDLYSSRCALERLNKLKLSLSS